MEGRDARLQRWLNLEVGQLLTTPLQWPIACPCNTICLFVCLFWDRVSLCSPGCPGYPGTHSVGQAGLQLRNPTASASQVLGLKACTTTARSSFSIYLSFAFSLFPFIKNCNTYLVHMWKSEDNLQEIIFPFSNESWGSISGHLVWQK